MTIDEFTEIAKMLKTMYRNDTGFMRDKAAFGLWYDLLKDLRFDVCKRASISYMKKSRFIPTVADIRGEYDAIWAEHLEANKRISDEFEAAAGYWPGITDEQKSNGRKLFVDYVNKCRNREGAAKALSQMVVNYVRGVESGGDTGIMSFTGYMGKAINELRSREKPDRLPNP